VIGVFISHFLYIVVNKSAIISKVESNLHEINSGYEDLRLQFDEYKKITEVLIQRDRFQQSTTFEYSNVIDKVNPSETKRYQDEVSRLKKDFLVRGRNASAWKLICLF
jgi:cellulose biosynthesis protein BcsQ